MVKRLKGLGIVLTIFGLVFMAGGMTYSEIRAW